MPKTPHLAQSQQFDWGSIRWLAEPGSGGVERISAGFATFNARSSQAEHPHTGYEELIYIVSGRGRHSVNGRTSELVPGALIYIPPFARHAIYNDNDAPLTLVSLYFPQESQKVVERSHTPTDPDADGDLWGLLDSDALSSLLAKLSQALGYHILLMDEHCRPLIDSGGAPEFCRILHAASKGAHCRDRMRNAISESKESQKSRLFICCNSVVGMLIPVLVKGRVRGYLKCGEIFLSMSDQNIMTDSLLTTAERYGLDPVQLMKEAASSVRVGLKSALYAAAEATLAVTSYIADMAAAAQSRKELDSSKLSLAREQMASARLEKALQEKDFKLLQSQVNPHFLFNTLSTVAQMAYIEGAEKAAELVWSLAGLLRHTLRKTEETIPLHEELGLLDDYVKIQQARFGPRLRVDWNIEPGLEQARIPCMLLQPLVENAFVHGLEPHLKPGRIEISARRDGGMVVCRIADNGVGFDPAGIAEKKDRIGLTSVRDRLRHHFAEAASFAVTSAPGQGAQCIIRLPLDSAVAAGRADAPSAPDKNGGTHA